MVTNKEIIETKRRIGEILHSFKIGYQDINAVAGPTVTLFELTPNDGVRISRIKGLKDEIAVGLRVPSVRVIAPMPNGTVGIEVPNVNRNIIPFVDMLKSDEYRHTDMALPLCMGKKNNNEVFMADLAAMPHLLVAGATGMGKSVGLNVIIASLINKKRPEELKFVLIDPKQVELTVYDRIARPYIAKLSVDDESVITDTGSALKVLNAVTDIMEERYTLLKEKNVRNIQEYNAAVSEVSPSDKLPYYVVIIDEYGDLIMQTKGPAMENVICRIAQKARAVGIHMIISTQRPSSDIVTARIKANFPTRIAFRTVTGFDSRVILDHMGAEKLVGKGDMLCFNEGETIRCQCAYISTEEVMELCNEIAEEYADCEQVTMTKTVTVQGNPNIIEIRPGLYRVRNKYGYWQTMTWIDLLVWQKATSKEEQNII